MKLFVDDVRNPPTAEWHLVRTVTEAIRVLATAPERVEEVSVDHDIGHQNMEEGQEKRYPCLETFEPVVRYIALMGREDRPRKVTIHTANVAKAQQMAALLNGTGIEVFINTANAWGARRAEGSARPNAALLQELAELLIDARGACWHGTPSQAVEKLRDAAVLAGAFPEGPAQDQMRLVSDALAEAEALCKEAKLSEAAKVLSRVHNIPLELARCAAAEERG